MSTRIYESESIKIEIDDPSLHETEALFPWRAYIVDPKRLYQCCEFTGTFEEFFELLRDSNVYRQNVLLSEKNPDSKLIENPQCDDLEKRFSVFSTLPTETIIACAEKTVSLAPAELFRRNLIPDISPASPLIQLVSSFREIEFMGNSIWETEFQSWNNNEKFEICHLLRIRGNTNSIQYPWLYNGKSDSLVAINRNRAKAFIGIISVNYDLQANKIKKVWRDAVPAATTYNPINLFLEKPASKSFDKANKFFMNEVFPVLMGYERQILRSFLALSLTSRLILEEMIKRGIDKPESAKSQPNICKDFDPFGKEHHKRSFSKMRKQGWVDVVGEGRGARTFISEARADFIRGLYTSSPHLFTAN